MVAWVLGKRDAETFKRLYDKVKHLKECIFYSDDWEAFAKILPKERHIVGKAHTHIIESNNSNTRHHLGRFTRKTKVVSKCENAVNYALKLWQALTQPDIFERFQFSFLSTLF
jgi:insertion element IS1 protein InsB